MWVDEMNDNELFELCKEVANTTKWGNAELPSFPRYERRTQSDPLVPIYNSDYLLGKLPYKIVEKGFLNVSMGNISAVAGYMSNGGKWEIYYRDKTPLLALLKLTLALYESGELKDGSKTE